MVRANKNGILLQILLIFQTVLKANVCGDRLVTSRARSPPRSSIGI